MGTRYFPGWQPAQDDWQSTKPGSDEDFSTIKQSLSLVIPSDDNQSSVSLERYEAWRVSTEGGQGCPDILLNAGGSVWAMDWLSIKVESGPPTDVAYLALGCHPANSPLHKIGIPVSGEHVIQVWEIPVDPESSRMPRLALLLQHDGGLTWHCQWCSRISIDSDRLGLLVGALGDGSVRIWSLPLPTFSNSTIKSGQPVERQESLDTLSGTPDPVASIHPHHVGGSMASRVDWLPHDPYDRLLVACWDGSVYVTQLVTELVDQPQGPQNMQVLCHFQADIVPLRTARWLPPTGNVEQHSIDNIQQNLFLTGGQEGVVKLWDARDQFSPIYSNLLGNYCIYDAAWTSQPLGILMAMEDGSIRGVVLDAEYLKATVLPGTKVSSAFIWRGRSPAGAIWRIGIHPLGHHYAYCGEDGVMGLANVEFYFDHRKRTSHMPLWAVRSEGKSLRIVSGKELDAEKANGGLFQKGASGRSTNGSTKEQNKKIILDSSQALHCLAWGPRSEKKSVRGYWLATGGAAGLVCIQWVPVAQ